MVRIINTIFTVVGCVVPNESCTQRASKWHKTFRSIESWRQCGLLCLYKKSTKGCTYWSYNIAGKSCVLQSGACNSFVSGPILWCSGCGVRGDNSCYGSGK